jgi:hypothetical protein
MHGFCMNRTVYITPEDSSILAVELGCLLAATVGLIWNALGERVDQHVALCLMAGHHYFINNDLC